MKYQFCKKCKGETVHETVVFNNMARSSQEQVTRCKKCQTVKDVRFKPIYPADEQRLRRRTF